MIKKEVIETITCDLCKNKMDITMNRSTFVKKIVLYRDYAGELVIEDICNDCMGKLMDFLKTFEIFK